MYSPNCKSIALVDENRVTMYDGLSGKEIYTIMDRTSKIESLFLNSNNGIGALGFYSGLSNAHREATSFFQLSNCKTIYFSIGRIYSINSNGEFFLNSNSDDIVGNMFN